MAIRTVAAPTGVAATDTTAINTAIAALVAGDTLDFRAGGRWVTNGGHSISTPCTILGPTGRGQAFNQNQQIYLANGANADMFTIAAPDVVIKDLSLYGNFSNQSATSRGLVYSTSGTNSYTLLDAVWVDSFNGNGYDFSSSGGTISGTVVNCEARLNKGYGMRFSGTATDMIVSNTYIDQNVQSGVHCSAGDILFGSCHIWGNGTGASGFLDGMTFQSSSGCRIEAGTYIESNTNGAGIRFATGTMVGHKVHGADIWNNGFQGIYAFGVSHCDFQGNTVRHNNFKQLTGSTGAGIAVESTTATLVKGNVCYSTGSLRQTWGVYEIGTGNSDLRIEGNMSRVQDHTEGGIYRPVILGAVYD